MNNDRGIALLIVLWIAVLLGCVTIAGAYISRLEIRQSDYSAREMQLIGAAVAGVEKVKVELVRNNYPYDSLKAGWNTAFRDAINAGDATVSITVEDEEGKVNLNTAPREVLEKLPSLAQAANGKELVDSLIDWKDPDANALPNGAEDDFYRFIDQARRCKNMPLDCLEELALVKGFRDPALPGARPKTATVHSDGKININTAPCEVLMALPGIDYSKAQAIIAARNGRDLTQGTEDDLPFDTIDRAASVVGRDIYLGIEKLITVKSTHFKVVVRAKSGKYDKIVEAMLFRQGNIVKIEYWKES